jgi:hypothetical protein
MTEPRDNVDDGPDFSFLGNDSGSDAPGEIDFSTAPQQDAETDFPDLSVEQPQPAMHGLEAGSSESASKTETPALKDALQASTGSTTRSATSGEDEVAWANSTENTTTPETASTSAPDDDNVTENAVPGQTRREPMVPQKTFSIVAGYAAALTLLFLILWATGRVSLTGAHLLESLPDIAPLQKNEFLPVEPADAGLPRDHTLKLGDSQRFGDIIMTPLKVTTEPIKFVHMSSGKTASDRTTEPVLKLWFELENASKDAAFPPWDVGLMCSRMPAEGTDDNTKANSWLMISHTSDSDHTRLLNYFHPPTSEYDLVGQHSRQLVQPGQTITTFIASSPEFSRVSTNTVKEYSWRLQLRKGVNRQSRNGVTTLVEVTFTQADISTSG